MNKFLSILSLAVALTPPHLLADQDSLDKLVEKEQANVDHEAVLVYGGTVGKLEAVFFLEWDETGNRIEGFYYYPSRSKENRYKLKGTNATDGEILLDEYTPQGNDRFKFTARCRLTKRVTNSHIIWEGQMNNTDGRQLTISLSRRR